MRLPWPFRGFQRAPAPGAAASAPPYESATARRDDWRRVPPISETVGPAPLVAPTAPFFADLSAAHPPPPVLAPLSHARGLDAPGGLVAGITRTVQRAPGSALPRPLQRRAAGKRQGEVGPEVMSAEPVSIEPVISSAATVAEQVGYQAVTPEVRPRQLAVADAAPRSASAQPVQRARLDLATVAPPRTVGLVGQPKPAGGSLQSSTTTPSTLPSPVASSPVAPGGPPSLVMPGLISRKPASGASTKPTSPLVSERPTLGQSRRLGLGAPIASVPTGMKKGAVSSPVPGLELASPPVVQRKAQEAPMTPSPARPETPATSPPAVSSPPVVPRPIRTAAPRPAAAASSAPLVSARPLQTRMQRAPLSASRPSRQSASPTDEPTPSGGPVRVHRGTVASDLAESLDAKAFTHQGEIYLPPSAGAIGSPAARSLLAHELTHVAQQRAFGSRLPQEHTAHGQELEAKAASAEKHPELPLAQPPVKPSASEAEPQDLASAQRRPTNMTQRSEIVDSTTINFPSSVQRAPARPSPKPSPATPDASDTKKSETELEELAGQLYGRISRRLRRELLVDRERAGLMVDLP
jgi:uncharacterized protein DUF4157